MMVCRIVWEGFDPVPSPTGTGAAGAAGAAPTINKDVVGSPFDSVHLTPWPHRPHHYYAAGYNVINTDWNPLYLVHGGAGFAAGTKSLSHDIS